MSCFMSDSVFTSIPRLYALMFPRKPASVASTLLWPALRGMLESGSAKVESF